MGIERRGDLLHEALVLERRDRKVEGEAGGLRVHARDARRATPAAAAGSARPVQQGRAAPPAARCVPRSESGAFARRAQLGEWQHFEYQVRIAHRGRRHRGAAARPAWRALRAGVPPEAAGLRGRRVVIELELARREEDSLWPAGAEPLRRAPRVAGPDRARAPASSMSFTCSGEMALAAMGGAAAAATVTESSASSSTGILAVSPDLRVGFRSTGEALHDGAHRSGGHALYGVVPRRLQSARIKAMPRRVPFGARTARNSACRPSSRLISWQGIEGSAARVSRASMTTLCSSGRALLRSATARSRRGHTGKPSAGAAAATCRVTADPVTVAWRCGRCRGRARERR